MRERKFWGWGYEDELLTDEEENNIDRRIASTFNLDSVNRIKVPNLGEIDLPEPRIKTVSYTHLTLPTNREV